MGRRKTSTAEDVIEIVARMPWWVGVGLAAASFLLFHGIASGPLPVAKSPDQVSGLMFSVFLHGISIALQYVAPILCLGGAIASAWGRHQRKALLEQASGSSAADVLDGMSWQEFEKLVGEAFRQQGYAVAETGGGGADGGVDLVLTKGSERSLVQCKQWRAYRVGVDVVRELYGVMAAMGAAGGFVVTSGCFTEEAEQFASGRNVKLLDGGKLRRMIGAVKAEAAERQRVEPAVEPPAPVKPEVPACPVCSRAMVQRVARQGSNAGRPFWGCPAFPSCRGTRPIR